MSISTESETNIKTWLNTRQLEVPPDFISQAARYLDIILDWSARLNLVSRNDLDNLVERHLLDSLTPIDEIPDDGNLADIGSGAGFPAIPIALFRPKLNIVMIESRGKKAEFLNEAISILGLNNIAIWQGRLEEFSPSFQFDILTIRGVSISEKIEKHLRRISRDSGKIIYYDKFNSYKLL